MKVRIYLAGPIMGCSDAEAQDWRTQARAMFADSGTPDFAARFECVDPMIRDYRGQETSHENVVDIVEGDLRDIAACNVMLAHCWKASFGTAMEIRHAAAEQRLPVYVVCPGPVSPWLQYHADGWFTTLQEAVDTIVAIHG